MSSSYPPPPTTDGTTNPDTSQQLSQQGPDAHSHAYTAHPQFIADAAAAAVAAAHHGLQALQAAVAAPPVAASTPVLSPSPVGGSMPSPLNSKATRLRRACDMCSQRKVKVSASNPNRPLTAWSTEADACLTRSVTRRNPAEPVKNSTSTVPSIGP